MRRRISQVRRAGSDRGAAAVEFVMISVLLVFLLLAVVQVAVYFYARTIVASAAADAARFAAARGVPVAAGAARAQELVAAGLDDNDARAVRCTGSSGRDGGSGLPVATVRCRGQLRLFFLPLGLPLSIDVSSSVLTEGAS